MYQYRVLHASACDDVTCNQWRRKQFASGGTMPALGAGRDFFDVPPHFSIMSHMRGHNDCLLPTERQLKW